MMQTHAKENLNVSREGGRRGGRIKMTAETQPFKAAYPACSPDPEVDARVLRAHMQPDQHALKHACSLRHNNTSTRPPNAVWLHRVKKSPFLSLLSPFL